MLGGTVEYFQKTNYSLKATRKPFMFLVDKVRVGEQKVMALYHRAYYSI